jgi:hypothetical protein
MGSASTRIGGFELAISSFNFYVDDTGVSKLISMTDSIVPAADSVALPAVVMQLAVKNTSSPTSPPASAETDPALESSTPSVGSNNLQDPPPSPTIAYCVDSDAYHFVGTGYFSSHEISGWEDPCRGTVAIYPTISECKRALNALRLQPAPYDRDYVEGLYSEYTCSDDDFYPEAKGTIGNSSGFSSGESALTGSGYVVDYDSDMLIEVGSYVGDDDIYPLAQGEISDDPTLPSGVHCMMASRGDGSGSRASNGRDRQTASGRFITQAQIRHARRVYSGELPLGMNSGDDKVAALRFIINEQKDQIATQFHLRRLIQSNLKFKLAYETTNP